MNFEKDIYIDENALDVELLEQGALAIEYGRHFAECKKEVAKATETVKLIRSELIRKANENPMKCCGKERPNAADIEAYYRDHVKHKKAKEALIEAEYELSIAEIAKNEICYTRKTVLENLVKLHGQQYFAGPRVPRDLQKERKERKKTAWGSKSIKTKRRRTPSNS